MLEFSIKELVFKMPKITPLKDKIIIRQNNRYYILNFMEIIYLERNKYGCILATSKEHFQIHISLRMVLDFLPDYFIRTHKSFIINTRLIKTIERINKNLYLVRFDNYINNNEVLISTIYVKNILSLIGD